MKRRYQDKTFLLEAGRQYDLKILKMLQLTDSQSFYIGVDENGLKHLVPEHYYKHYVIKTGDTVRCRLDRINCLGRFFFEPEHPFYKRGGIYHFSLKSFSGGSNNLFTAKVTDQSGREWETLPFDLKGSLPAKIKTLLCRVLALKKARLYLQVVDQRLGVKHYDE